MKRRARTKGRRRSPARLRKLPPAGWALVVVAALAAANLAYHVVRKPTELLGAVAPAATKTPDETWTAYRRLFEAHATGIVTPALLAALVQVESAGDPLARTYWRWRWTWNPFEIYAPASSAVGLLQITDGTFAEARRLCIHDHEVARDGPWLDPDACWFNGLYFRTVPSHAIEMTAAWLHTSVVETLAAVHAERATLDERQRLAVVIHLCGRERAASFARHGFRAIPGERCGDHDLAVYLARVVALRDRFARLEGAG